MSNLLKDLLAQRATLEQQILEAQRAEKADAVSRIRALMAEYGLTLADLQASPRAVKPARGPRAGAKVAPKYRDAASGNTWSGRGLQPRWLRDALASGRKLADFMI